MILKLFENFKRLYIKVEVTPQDRERFLHLYGIQTGRNASNEIDVVYRKPGPTAWGIAYRIHFEAEQWVIDSLTRLGHHIEPLKGNIYCCSREELFWDLMDYGYRIGENEAIPYDFVIMKQSLVNCGQNILFPITMIETENPINEAQILAA